jgi:hypothetical protein
MSKFTEDMAFAVRQIPHPYPGLIVDFVEFPDYIGIRVYENQIMELNDNKRVTFMEYLQQLRQMIELAGEKAFFDGVAGDPPSKRR